ncbi:FHA domain-containing protein [Streptomyces sp. P9(2023)]|uniref:FHA domain-containing protein n=1 Tax=Streptomyces sp. P9(2023) TaxID=3064394 RepID=UPI0028F42422|nr:FHA domain-containing protein [Streptomyces sp. P9(2023)]MDT9690293.1 FHA domain-containing protein [Streptomyces sp. P9(2023)]
MPTCPNGHQSVSDDWCEVCGHRMAGAGAPAGAVPPPPPPPPAYGYPGPGGPGGHPGGPPGPPPGGYDPNATAHAELCPQCRTPREAMAPFCEECRWNFLTNTATSYTPVAPPSPQQSPPPGLNLPPGFQTPPRPAQPQPDPYEYQSSRPSQMNRPAEPLSADPTHHQAPPQQPGQPGQPGHPQQPGYPQQPQQPGQPQPPQGFQQGPPPPPPAFFQAPAPAAPPAPPQRQDPPAGDDWVLPPPSQPQAPPQAQQPQMPQQQMPQQQYQPPRPAAGWSAYIGPDRDYFMAMMHRSGPEATGLNLPAYSPEQHLPLQGNQISIGRRRHSTGESPDIDLSVPPEDPGVSHQHAVLVQQPDGSWAVVDQNSTNGTTINGAEEPIQPYVPIQLQDGDRVHVGAWTTITIRRG